MPPSSEGGTRQRRGEARDAPRAACLGEGSRDEIGLGDGPLEEDSST